MSGADLVARPETLQVTSPVFQVLLVLTFVLHLFLMNIALGGSMINAVYRLRRKEALAAASNLPTTLALAVNLGVPPLLFVQVLFGQFFYSSSVLMAVYWLAVVPILIVAYYAAYIMQRKGRPAAGTIWSLVSALLLLAIAFIYVNNMSLMLRYDRWPELLQGQARAHAQPRPTPPSSPASSTSPVGALAVASISWSAGPSFREMSAASEADEHSRRRPASSSSGYSASIEAVVGLAWLGTLPKGDHAALHGRLGLRDHPPRSSASSSPSGMLGHAIARQVQGLGHPPRADHGRHGPPAGRLALVLAARGISRGRAPRRAAVRAAGRSFSPSSRSA